MNYIKYLLISISILFSNTIFSQDTLGMKETYIDNNLVYKMNGEKFTGIAQSKRKNGHLVYEEIYSDGIIQYSNLYFNGKEKIVYIKTIYNRNKLWVVQKEIRFRHSKDTLEVKTYDENGKKTLLTQFENNRVTYTCEYNGKKKNGLALGYANGDGKITYRCEYFNGKKDGEEFCIKENGKKWTKKYKNGKRIK